VTEEKATSKTDKENVSPAERLAGLAKTNFGIGSFRLTLSYLGTQTVDGRQ